MAYASAVALTVVPLTRNGVSSDETMVAATATHGNKFLNDGRTFLRVINGDASPITATVYVERTIDDLVLPDLEVTIAATADGDGLDDLLIGPFTTNFQQTDGYVWVTFSAVTSVTVGVFRV